MKVLHLEDSAYKHHHICDVLHECGIREIDWVITLKEGLDKIRESLEADDPYDLIITDMNYPVSGMQRSGVKLSGELLIDEMKESDIQIPVILCSSINYKYPEIYGTVYYSERNDWENELRTLIRSLKENGNGTK